MLTRSQQARLKAVARKSGHPDLGTNNERLDKVIAEIQEEAPHLFWQEWELKERNFFDQPVLHPHQYRSYVMEDVQHIFKGLK